MSSGSEEWIERTASDMVDARDCCASIAEAAWTGAPVVDVERFQRDGYLRVEHLVGADVLDVLGWLAPLYDRLFAERAGESDGTFLDLAGPDDHTPRLRQIVAPDQKLPELAAAPFADTARQLAASLLGAEAESLKRFDHMILKPAGHGHETLWHQDEAYWDPRFDHEGVSVWIPLEDATVASGCMQFIPGSHRGPVVPHRHIGDDPRTHGLVTGMADPAAAVACPLAAGGAAVYHCRTLHYAGPNRTASARRAYVLVFTVPPVRRATPADRPWLDDELRARENAR